MALQRWKAWQAARAAAVAAKTAAKKTSSSSSSSSSSASNTAPAGSSTPTPKSYNYVINGKPITLSAAQYSSLTPASQQALEAKYKPTAITPTVVNAPQSNATTTPTTAPTWTNTSILDAWNKLSAAQKLTATNTRDQWALNKITSAWGVLPSKLWDLATEHATAPLETTTTPPAPSGFRVDTVVAGNGKVYKVEINPTTGQAQFRSANDGMIRTFNSREDAIREISAKNNWFKSLAEWETAGGQEGSPFADKNTEYMKQVEEDRVKDQELITNLQNSINSIYQNLWNTASQSAQTIQNITNQRMAGMQTAYANIATQMDQLETKANAVFDQGAMRQAVAKAKQLAAQGYMTNEQVAQVANYDVSAYRRDAELAKTELEKTIAEQRINIEKEKLSAQDAIQKDMSLNEQQRQQVSQQIEQRYAQALDTLNTKQTATNQLYNQLQNQYNTAASAQDMAQQQLLSTDQTTYDVQQQQRQRAMSDPIARRDYLVNQVRDANVLKYVDIVIKQLQNSGQFMALDLDTLQQYVLAAATLLQKRNETAGAHTGM